MKNNIATLGVIATLVFWTTTFTVAANMYTPSNKMEVDVIEEQQENAQQTVNMLVTAYTYSCGNGDGYTATMTKPKVGTLAVDPDIIPYGTRLYVPGYGYGVAEDTGGLIKGNRLDLFMQTREEALKWGVKELEVVLVCDSR